MVIGEAQLCIETDCESSSSQGCDIDEQRMSLLQMEVRLKNEHVAPSLATQKVAAVASKPVASKLPAAAAVGALAATSRHLELLTQQDQQKSKKSIAVASGEGRSETSKEGALSGGSSQDSSVPVRYQAPSMMEMSVNRTRDQGLLSAVGAFSEGLAIGANQSTASLVLVGGIVCLCICLVFSFCLQSASASATRATPQMRLSAGLPPPASGSALNSQIPGAQQLLQAPRRTAPNAPNLSSGPPPICPSLILPHTEARFMIPIESLMRASGELDIRGTSGRKLLNGSVTETPDGNRCLALASCGCEEDPRVTVVAPARDGQGPLSGTSRGMRTMELFGKGGSFYGTLEPGPDGGAVLRCEGEIVMTLDPGAGDLRMTASSMDGRLLASAGKNVQVAVRQLESHDTWKLQVKPGLDAVLIVSCMLGALLFGQ